MEREQSSTISYRTKDQGISKLNMDRPLGESVFLQSEASGQVVSKAKDNFRKDDDVRWYSNTTRVADGSARVWDALSV